MPRLHRGWLTRLQRSLAHPTATDSAVVRAHDRFALRAPDGQPRPQPAAMTPPRQGATLVLLYRKVDRWFLVLTERAADLPYHAGQISLPGGGWQPGDASLAATAVRECQEELGVWLDRVELLGALSPLYIPPSHYLITPYVGRWHGLPPLWRPDPSEVAGVLEVPVAALLAEEAVLEEIWELRGLPARVPLFRYRRRKIWGATAQVLAEFVDRIRGPAAPR